MTNRKKGQIKIFAAKIKQAEVGDCDECALYATPKKCKRCLQSGLNKATTELRKAGKIIERLLAKVE